jgi:hypothetical protein
MSRAPEEVLADRATSNGHLCAYEEQQFPDEQFGDADTDGRRHHLGTNHLDDGSTFYDPPVSDTAPE